MSVDSIAGLGAYQNTRQSLFQQERQYFNQLVQALQTGDLTGAQQAFTALTQIIQQTPEGQNANPTGPQSQIQKDLAAVGQALQSGDLGGAQKAFAAVQQDIQNARLAHHGQHGGGSHAGAAATDTVDSGGTDSDGDNDGSGGVTTGVNISA
jgi:DNA-binding FadR family transcriptional regulator